MGMISSKLANHAVFDDNRAELIRKRAKIGRNHAKNSKNRAVDNNSNYNPKIPIL